MEPRKAAVGGAVIALGGLALGAHLFGAEPASAQAGSYRECLFGKQEAVDIDDQGRVHLPNQSRTILVRPATRWSEEEVHRLSASSSSADVDDDVRGAPTSSEPPRAGAWWSVWRGCGGYFLRKAGR